MPENDANLGVRAAVFACGFVVLHILHVVSETIFQTDAVFFWIATSAYIGVSSALFSFRWQSNSIRRIASALFGAIAISSLYGLWLIIVFRYLADSLHPDSVVLFSSVYLYVGVFQTVGWATLTLIVLFSVNRIRNWTSK